MYHTNIKQLKTYLKNTLFEFPDGSIVKAHKLLDRSKIDILKKNMKKHKVNNTSNITRRKRGAGLDVFKPTNNSIRTADSHSSWSMTDKEINPSPEGANLNLHRFNMKCHLGAMSVIALYSHAVSQNITAMDAPLLRDVCAFLNLHYNPGYPPEVMCQLIEREIVTMGMVAAATVFTRVAWPTYIKLYEKCLKLPVSGGSRETCRETTFPLRPLPSRETTFPLQPLPSRETTFPLQPLPLDETRGRKTRKSRE